MTNDQREIRCKLRILVHAEVTGKVSKTWVGGSVIGCKNCNGA